jgi:hypothetical protein
MHTAYRVSPNVFSGTPNSRYVCVGVIFSAGAARDRLVMLGYRPTRGRGGLSMPRVLLGDKIYPWVAGVVLAVIILDLGLVWSLF